MDIQETITKQAQEAIKTIYGVEVKVIELQPTRKDFEGDITLVVFPLLRHVKGNPVKIGEDIGTVLEENIDEIAGFNVVKGFLNLILTDAYYLDFFNEIKDDPDFGINKTTKPSRTVMVEYSSPNTNKPLHLGHVRNNLLGFSVSRILEADGNKVYKTQIINDRGIHICKSMVAWLKFADKDDEGNRQTPASTGIKGDKFVGDFYVQFDKAYKQQIAELTAEGISQKQA